MLTVILPAALKYLVILQLVLYPKVLVRVVVYYYPLASVRGQIQVLLVRKLIGLVYEYPVARAALCRFRVIVAGKLYNPGAPARRIGSLAYDTARALKNLEKLAEPAPATQYVLAVLVRALSPLLARHRGEYNNVALVIRL